MTPANRLATILYQDLNSNALIELEKLARTWNYKAYMSYPYMDNRQGQSTGSISIDPSSISHIKQRQLRAIGSLMGVPWNVSYGQTRTDLGAVISAL